MSLPELLALIEEMREYLDHDNWRCGHPERYGGCVCGLVELDAKIAALTGTGRDMP